MTHQNISCPKCNCQDSHFKGQKIRRFKMTPIGSKKCYLDVVLHRLKCLECDHQWWPRLPFMKGKFQMTRSLIQYAFDLLSISTIQDISRLLGISWNVIKKIHKMKLEKLYRKIDLKKVKYVSVDEFAIKKGQEYMTVFSDIESGRIIHAVESRKVEHIVPFLLKLARKANNLKAIAMDMSVSYISAVQNFLPGVDIVFDHFHVNALMNKTLDEIRKDQQQNLNQREEKVLKGNRFLFLKNYEDLEPEFKDRLEAILQINEPLFKAHALKEQFRLFWQQGSVKKAWIFLDQWISDARATGIRRLKKMAETLDKHRIGLLSYFKHGITNAAAEGINNKIKTMKRQAYGFRDMEYFKLRLYHLHEQRYAFVG
ncbi:MAG TPA: ISL3 family transposase [Puia sp.]|nr:ISL3 family transposase [Puia sp.]